MYTFQTVIGAVIIAIGLLIGWEIAEIGRFIYHRITKGKR